MQQEALSPSQPGVQPFLGAAASSADPVASRLPALWHCKSPEPPVPGEHLHGQRSGAAPGWANSLLLTCEMRAGKFSSIHLQMLSL